jgi:Arc/MetJ-type ribon-helix-helix transcriptional regulator
MTIEITRPEVEAMIKERLESGRFKDAEDVVRQALELSPKPPRKHTLEERSAAIDRLVNFGKDHGISLGDMTLEELREEARP